ncbi:hypothetical protein [Pyxidicoccus xibeiensis]|uniref:hypothetical protein n=1 Tax=Pyxidicoccus xibeiensis TaxID=2906759 RepID=UPI0020A724E9|nr:hypothetical protein [Pyxidicoccus xibeiensis]MCP3142581.1 hypothetical protein [Pyxidicoccus xibeiensis]
MSLAAAVLLRRVFGIALWVLMGSPALAAEPWRAVVRVASEEDAALLVRVRGQSSDLPVLLEAVPGPPLDGAAAEQWREAEQLAARQQARAVLWFLRVGPEVRVQVAEPASRHLFVRASRLDGRPGSLEWSVGAEALALAVRSALRAVEAGEPLGEVVEAPPPAPVAERVVEVPPAPAPVPTVSASRWMLAVGAHASLDGYTSGGHQGLLLGAGWEGRSLRLRLQVLAGLPARLRDARTQVTLGQYSAALWADVPVVSGEALELSAGLGAGVVGFSRATEALAPEVEAEPSRVIPALLVGPELAARWRAGSRLAFEVSLAAELLLGRPALGYAVDGNLVSRGDGWVARPRVGLAMVLFP